MTTKRKGANSNYFGDIVESVKTLSKGLALTLRHIFQATKSRDNAFVSDKNYFDQKTGIVTLSYPYESLPVPDNGRYRLHNEIDDCIVCDKCAKICPVNCITIESLKATEEIGKTSDGTSKRLYAPIFDIDLAKCCYCGLCTTVCPTECLTMTKVYDFSEADVENFLYKFSNLSPSDVEEKKKELETFNAQKEAAKASKIQPPASADTIELQSEQKTATDDLPTRTTFKPKFKTPIASSSELGTEQKDSVIAASKQLEHEEQANETKPSPRPVFKPKVKPAILPKQEEDLGKFTKDQTNTSDPVDQIEESEVSGEKNEVKPARPLFKPKVRPTISAEKKEEVAPELKAQDHFNSEEKVNLKAESDKKHEDKTESKSAGVRPVFRPKIRPQKPKDDNETV